MQNNLKSPEKTDILFLHVPKFVPKNKTDLNIHIPIMAMGLFSICNELKKNGFSPKIINYGIMWLSNKKFEIEEYVKKNDIKIVAFSLHWHYQSYNTMILAKKIKEKNPNTFIVLGGYTASAFAEEIIKKYKFIDGVIKGEGEKPNVELVKAIKNNPSDLSKVPNLYWRKNDQVIVNNDVWFANEEELNSYNFDGFEFLEKYKEYLHTPKKISVDRTKKEIILSKNTKIFCCLGRGCAGNCTWCGGGFEAVKNITGRNKITLRNPKIVASEILNIYEKYNIDFFYICYDPFPNNQEYILEMFEILGEKQPNKININFENFGLPTKSFIDSVKKNLGSRSSIIISPEFGDEEMRRQHKSFWFSNKDFYETLDYIIQKEIYCLIYFTKLPFQSEINNEITKKMILELNSKYENNKYLDIEHQKILDTEPYSPWWIDPKKYGIRLKLKTFEDFIINQNI